MTIDERIERLEFVTAAHIEQAKKDYEENRRIWREHQTEVAAIWRAMERRSEEMDRRWEETNRRWRETDDRWREARAAAVERDVQVDDRIKSLVSAIGELIQRLDKK